MFKESIYLIGAGSHAKIVMTTLEACGIGCKGIFDDDEALRGQEVWNVPILGTVSEMPDTSDTVAVIGIASNRTRRGIAQRFKNVAWPVIIHPQSVVHSSVRIGEGTAILAGCIIQADTVIGSHSIINTASVIDHDCIISDYCHVAPRSCVADGVLMGEGAFLGIGSVVIPYINIGTGAVIGAGSVVTSNLECESAYVGNPARRIPKSPNNEESFSA